jgi:hypothetical protein
MERQVGLEALRFAFGADFGAILCYCSAQISVATQFSTGSRLRVFLELPQKAEAPA